MSVPHLSRKRAGIAAVAVAGLAFSAAGSASGHAFGWWASFGPEFNATADHFSASKFHPVVSGDVLKNDFGATAVVDSSPLSDPTAGDLEVSQDGTFTFTPASGKHGTVTFTYSATDAVELFKDSKANGEPLDSLGTFPGPGGTVTDISGGVYGSSLYPAPGKPGYFYGVTDRGPNADAGDGSGKVEPMPDSFVPKIGLFHLVGGNAVLVSSIDLRAKNGTPYSGKPNPVTGFAASKETIQALDGSALVADPFGYDPEGLVVLKDGTFWISDEYGPYITHFDKTGKEIERLSPWTAADSGDPSTDDAHLLPAEFQLRSKNKGAEGLTVTPDGKTLVVFLQSAITQKGGATAANQTVTRFATIDLKTKKTTHEYVYLLDDPRQHTPNTNAVSEVTALSSTQFLVDERDGNTGAGTFKQVYLIDTTGATDVRNDARYSTTYVAGTQRLDTNAQQGLLVNGQSLELYVGLGTTQQATNKLLAAGIKPVSKEPFADLGALMSELNWGKFYGHDKIEGAATTDGGKTIYLANDSDFGLDYTDGTAHGTPTVPYLLHQKTLPDGQVDDGVILKVDVSKLPVVTKTGTVTITF